MEKEFESEEGFNEVAELIYEALGNSNYDLSHGNRFFWIEGNGHKIIIDLKHTKVEEIPVIYMLNGKEVTKEEYLKAHPEEAYRID